jgi:tetratricopeptide (TPR) repeat protein
MNRSLPVVSALLLCTTVAAQTPARSPGTKKADPTALYTRALALQQQGKLDDAIRVVTEALRIAPNNAAFYATRGQCRAERDPQAALVDFDRAVGLDPRNDDALTGRAAVHAALGNVAQAIIDYSAAAAIRPMDPVPIAGRVALYEKQGDWERALADADQVVRLRPKSDRAYALRARIRTARKENVQALADRDRQVALAASTDASALTDRASLRLQMALERSGTAPRPLGDRFAAAPDHYDAALADLSEAVRRAPQNRSLRILRLSVLMEKGDWSAALDAADALQADSGTPDGDLIALRGYCQLRQGNLDDALTTLRDALGRTDKNPNVCLNIAVLYAARLDADASRKLADMGLMRLSAVEIEQHRRDAESLAKVQPNNDVLAGLVLRLQGMLDKEKKAP